MKGRQAESEQLQHRPRRDDYQQSNTQTDDTNRPIVRTSILSWRFSGVRHLELSLIF
jgi:hypothetical protein